MDTVGLRMFTISTSSYKEKIIVLVNKDHGYEK